ncbi:hypothetical protein H4R34_000493 [Dimargaris verticillata]|uniref:Uncharacterized protein n=1 Tax=Dimargaris verticillata TaxID=2761393 RepID=A0A9W8EB94_9FUNG|nr:hypothetical protein H4R34_000493 [Dimargaris verticillata]
MAAIAVLTHSPIFDVLRGYIATLYTLYIAPTFIKAGLVMSQALGIYDAPVCFGFRHYRVCWAHSQVEMAVKLLISLVVVLTLAVIPDPSGVLTNTVNLGAVCLSGLLVSLPN